MFDTKVDLHVHSKHSSHPSEWVLRRLGAPESFVEPLEIYSRCRERGMNLVTISDHNCINGALEIAHLPGTFLSTEITTYFPEDGCKIHCLASGITEKQFAEIEEVRDNIYELRDYLRQENIAHSITHALFAVNDQLTLSHFEKLLLLFNCFERVNGARGDRANHLLGAVCESLDREIIEEMANRHNISPGGPEPWRKRFTAGSDDHSGLYLGSTYTTAPPSATVEEFLTNLRHGRHGWAGSSGSSLQLAHSIYLIAYAYYKDRFLGRELNSQKPDLLGGLLRKLLENPAEATRGNGLIRRALTRISRPWKTRHMSEGEQMLIKEFSRLFQENNSLLNKDNLLSPAASSFAVACRISQGLTYRFLEQFIERLKKGGFIESLQTLVALGPVFFSVAPYFTAFRSQHKDDKLLEAVAQRFPNAGQMNHCANRKVWLRDGEHGLAGNISGVPEVVSRLSAEPAAPAIITCLKDGPEQELNIWRNFKPVGVFELPGYEEHPLNFPPLLEIVEYLESREIGELIISTPGPLGAAGLVAARLLDVPTVGIYNINIPATVLKSDDDQEIAQLAQRYVQWFYSQCNVVYAPDTECREQLTEGGIKVRSWSEFPLFDLNKEDRRDMLTFLGLTEQVKSEVA